MKIAILTQPLHSNYGGILQAYALQTVLKHEGHDVITANRLKGYPSFKLLLFRIGSFFKCVIRRYIKNDNNYVICNPFKKGDYAVHPVPVYDNSLLEDFIAGNIKLSAPIYSTRELRRFIKNNQIDCVIVGSDQVWREAYSPWITNYFLDFLGDKSCCKIKKYAYAASFGVENNAISRDNIGKCSRLLKSFDAVSVREYSAKNYLIKSLSYDKASVVLDPTLLLSPTTYVNLMKQEDIYATGLVSYILDNDPEKEFIVDDVAKNIGKQRTRLTTKPIETMKLVSISKWLSSIAYADFIVTDSFHGCVFSIIFKKKFIAIGNKVRGLDRFHTLLNNFDLSNRLVMSKDEYLEKANKLMEDIDYKKVTKAYDQLRNASIDFIKSI